MRHVELVGWTWQFSEKEHVQIKIFHVANLFRKKGNSGLEKVFFFHKVTNWFLSLSFSRPLSWSNFNFDFPQMVFPNATYGQQSINLIKMVSLNHFLSKKDKEVSRANNWNIRCGVCYEERHLPVEETKIRVTVGTNTVRKETQKETESFQFHTI